MGPRAGARVRALRGGAPRLPSAHTVMVPAVCGYCSEMLLFRAVRDFLADTGREIFPGALRLVRDEWHRLGMPHDADVSLCRGCGALGILCGDDHD